MTPYGFIKNASTPKLIVFMADETDKDTPETGLTVAVKISKNGGSFATCTNSPATEIADGYYSIVLTATETNTDGPVILEASATGAAESRQVFTVAEADNVTMADAEIEKHADIILRRALSSVFASSDGDTPARLSLLGALMKIVGVQDLDGSNDLNVKKADGTTAFYTIPMTTGTGPTNPVIGQE